MYVFTEARPWSYPVGRCVGNPSIATPLFATDIQMCGSSVRDSGRSSLHRQPGLLSDDVTSRWKYCHPSRSLGVTYPKPKPKGGTRDEDAFAKGRAPFYTQ